MTYSILENGHMHPAMLPIGSLVTTQWGDRRVVGHKFISHDCKPTEPYGC